jgi:two-component system nitrate/nitrite response regulator NarL
MGLSLGDRGTPQRCSWDSPPVREPLVHVLVAVGDRGYGLELAATIRDQTDCVVEHLPGDVGETLLMLLRSRPELAIVDEDLPGGGARAVLAGMSGRAVASDVLVLAHSPDSLAMAEMLSLGAAGYVNGGSDPRGLLLTVECALRGEILMSRHSLAELLREPASSPVPEPEAMRKYLSLTRRERRVLHLLADGIHPQVIAKEMNITTNTARTHIQHVISKLGVHSCVEAATYAIDTHLTEMPV